MKINIDFEYTEEVIPRRCRKLRPVKFQDKYITEIREVTGNEAPIAIIENDQSHNYYDRFKNGIIINYHLYNGQLYVRYDLTDRDRYCPIERYPYWQLNTPNSDGFNKTHSGNHVTLEERKNQIEEWAKTFLYIDGVLFFAQSEPRYAIMTFGLGCNHGGTSLSIHYNYNPNISYKAYFPINKREEAIKTAEETALNRGDNKSVPIQISSSFEILIPEAIQVQPDIQHGNGDPFINKIEGMISAVQNPLCVGISIMSDMATYLDSKSCKLEAILLFTDSLAGK